MRPEQWNRPWGAMVIGLGGEGGFLLAVPKKVSLETLADILHRLGVAVETDQAIAAIEPGLRLIREALAPQLEPRECVGPPFLLQGLDDLALHLFDIEFHYISRIPRVEVISRIQRGLDGVT